MASIDIAGTLLWSVKFWNIGQMLPLLCTRFVACHYFRLVSFHSVEDSTSLVWIRWNSRIIELMRIWTIYSSQNIFYEAHLVLIGGCFPPFYLIELLLLFPSFLFQFGQKGSSTIPSQNFESIFPNGFLP